MTTTTTTTKPPRQKKPPVTHADFVAAWRTALAAHGSAADVSRATGLAPVSVAARAKKLRAAGVNLDEFPRVAKVIDVAALNAIIPTVVQQ